MAGSPPKPPSPPPPFPKHPSAAELIGSYLRPRVLSGAARGEFIHEADLYAAGPDDLTRQFAPATSGDGEKAWYFFTTLKFKSELRVAINRAVDTGEGRWEEEERSPQPVFSELAGRPAPTHQTFAFVRKEGAMEVRSGWFMMELRLDPREPLAMCKVYRSQSGPKAIDAAAASGRTLEIREAGRGPVAEKAAAAASPGGQKKAVVGEGGGAATTAWRAAVDAARKDKAPVEAEEDEAPAPAVHAMDAFPSEAELINTYLRPWVDSGENAGKFIHVADVYTDAPADLTRRFTPAAARDRGEEAWFFLTKLRPHGKNVTRRVDSGKGRWSRSKALRLVPPDDGTIGQSQTFTFTKTDGKTQTHFGWLMRELRLNASDPNALYKMYRNPMAKADGGSPAAEADDEASSAVGDGAVAYGREEDGEEIDSSAAGSGLKRKADDKDSGAETAGASPGRQNKTVGENPGAAALDAVEEVEDPVDASEEVEAPAEPEEPNDPSKPKLHDFF